MPEPDGFSPSAMAELERLFDVTAVRLDRRGLIERSGVADVLWVRLGHRIDAELLQSATRLKVIVTATTGLNHIEVGEAERRGIVVLSLKGENEFLKGVRATAEHTLALLLAVIRRVAPASAHAVAGGWDRDRFKGNELFGKTAGVIGYGRLGGIVAGYLHALGMDVLASDPHRKPADCPEYVRFLPLESLLTLADVVTVHVNLDETTQNLLGESQFALMKRGSWLVNTSRGELIDEGALLRALESGKLAGAALDVLRDEPPKSGEVRPLLAYAGEYDNLIVTPHVGGCTVESMERTERFMVDKLAKFVAEKGIGGVACAG